MPRPSASRKNRHNLPPHICARGRAYIPCGHADGAGPQAVLAGEFMCSRSQAKRGSDINGYQNLYIHTLFRVENPPAQR